MSRVYLLFTPRLHRFWAKPETTITAQAFRKYDS